MNRRWVVVFFLLYFSATPQYISTVAGAMNSPDEFYSPPAKKKPTATNSTAFSGLIFKYFIRFFQRTVSPLDGPRSPSYPTGSAYGVMVVKKYGFVLGSVLTADRLFHEADYYQGKYIKLHGVYRYFDPPEFNTYWWESSVSEKESD